MGNSRHKRILNDRITVWVMVLLSSIGALGSQFSCKNSSEWFKWSSLQKSPPVRSVSLGAG